MIECSSATVLSHSLVGLGGGESFTGLRHLSLARYARNIVLGLFPELCIFGFGA